MGMSDDRIQVAKALARLPGMQRDKCEGLVGRLTQFELRRGCQLARRLEQWDESMREWLTCVGDRIAQDEATAET